MARCLVVDDDADVRAYLGEVLERYGVEPVFANDGQEAAAAMRNEAFDIAFVDLTLPTLSGEFLLRLLERGQLRQPRTVALMSGADKLAEISDASWAREAHHVLAKPFGVREVKAVLERSLGSVHTVIRAIRRGAGFVGTGLWVDALQKVVTGRGAPVTRVPLAVDLARVRDARPAVVVIGAPLDGAALLALCADVHRDPAFQGASVFAAMPRLDAGLAADLLLVGADRTFSIEHGLARLSDEVLRLAGAPRREHMRAPFASTVLVRGREIQLGNAFDLGIGGIGLGNLTSEPTKAVEVEFMLPGEEQLIAAKSDVAWIRKDAASRTRVGLRFTGLEARAAERIRSYVTANA